MSTTNTTTNDDIPVDQFPFPTVSQNKAAPPVSRLGPGFTNGTFPIPTNQWWSNLMLGDGSNYVPQTPYSIKCGGNPGPGLHISRTDPIVIGPTYAFQPFNADVTISSHPVSPDVNGEPFVLGDVMGDFSVQLNFGSFSIPLVRGSPFITAIFQNPKQYAPVVSTIHAITSNTQLTPTKAKLGFNDGTWWLIYSNCPVTAWHPLGGNGTNSGLVPVYSGEDGTIPDYSVVIRIVRIPNDSGAESLLDESADIYPLGGSQDVVTLSSSSTSSSSSSSPQLPVWERVYGGLGTLWGQSTGAYFTGKKFLALLLPHHYQQFQVLDSDGSTPLNLLPLTYTGIRGQTAAVWVNAGDPYFYLKVPDDLVAKTVPRFYDPFLTGVVGSYDDLHAALAQDIAGLPADPGVSFPPDSYSFGKVVARTARLALIANQLGETDQCDRAVAVLRSALNIWLVDQNGKDAWVYDSKFGIVTTSNGCADAGADYGAGLFNDVGIFHQGYHLYAIAVLCLFDHQWGRTGKVWTAISALVQNIASISRTSETTDFLRYHDAFELMTYASGLTGFGDGWNKESTSEAANTYYAISLLGQALGDSHCQNLGHLLAVTDVIAAQTYWHLSPQNGLIQNYPMIGNIFSNKIDVATWFSPAPSCTLGIQVLPVTPWTRVLFSDTEWAKNALAFVQSVIPRLDTTIQWRGLLLPLLVAGGVDPQTLVPMVNAMDATKDFDNGNSKTNLLYYLYTTSGVL